MHLRLRLRLHVAVTTAPTVTEAARAYFSEEELRRARGFRRGRCPTAIAEEVLASAS